MSSSTIGIVIFFIKNPKETDYLSKKKMKYNMIS